MKVRLPITDSCDCINAYRAYNLNIGPGQLCAGGVKSKDSCLGDSGSLFLFGFTYVTIYLFTCIKNYSTHLWNVCQTGGPLMYFDRRNSIWVASGIVSFGAAKCGTVGIPGLIF